ncbi:MAG TPA: tRNA pseudouridine(13) synthase TruD [Methanoregulaceae archaeon]|nr:tRNA pseudouridine(13) synthase TruD [Methanoregulaceae archaeon]
MKKSSHPLEISLGMEYYVTDTQGTGGNLRSSPEDFVVEEIPCEVGEEGRFLICQLTKKDWEQQRAVREVAKKLGISHRRIGWGGTKDKHALTRQLISIYDVTPEDIERLNIKDINLEVMGRSKSALSLGSHLGNRFRITIRNTSADDLPNQVELVTAACREGVPNYYGIQRFGVIRPITHLVGEYILLGDYEGAVCCYVGRACPGEPSEVQEARTLFMERRDPVEALHHLPVPLSYERTLLHHLSSRPGDYKGALLVLPPKLLSMFVSAFQSFLFNKALSARIEEGRELNIPSPGDRLIFEGGREDRVTTGNMRGAMEQCKRGRCRIAIFMQGSRPFSPIGPDDTTMASLMEMHGITPEHFRQASEYVKTRFEGAFRPVSLSTDISTEINGKDLSLAFSLPPGQYATTICREFMKADPIAMI